MKNETKLERLKKFLDENGICYLVPKKHRNGHCDLFIPKYNVIVKLQGEDDEVFFQRYKARRYPVFIRTEDTPKFVIEKVQNTIIKSMMNKQAGIMKRREKQG